LRLCLYNLSSRCETKQVKVWDLPFKLNLITFYGIKLSSVYYDLAEASISEKRRCHSLSKPLLLKPGRPVKWIEEKSKLLSTVGRRPSVLPGTEAVRRVLHVVPTDWVQPRKYERYPRQCRGGTQSGRMNTQRHNREIIKGGE